MSSTSIPLPLNDSALELSIKNISEFGDTDVFPFPIENHWFFDQPESVLKQLQAIRDQGESAYSQMPLFSSTELTNTGFLGFRAATQIDPLWNACFLAAVIGVAAEVEASRLPDDRIFSYRYAPDSETGALFSKVGWKDFHLRGLELSRNFSHVALVDISDFYSRIYHHRLENALRTDCGCDGASVKFIDNFLRKVNAGHSFGLPVGGPASRILAEALLNRTDHLLETHKISFIRFVDDYMVFGRSEDAVRTSVLEISRLLLDNEGLTLNRNKTRLLSCEEYRRQSVFAEPNDTNSEDEKEKRRFFSLHLRYDPYSPTAQEDYDALAAAIRQHDVLGMLEKELTKSRIDRFALSQLVKALRFMDDAQRSDAVKTLADNLQTLSPIFATAATAFRKIRDQIDESAQSLFFLRVRELLQNRSPLIGASGTLSFAVRLLADDPAAEADAVLQAVYSQSGLTPMLEREVVLAMARRKSNYWISDLRSRHATVRNPWAFRALLAGSFILGDEGRHWRQSISSGLSSYDKAYLDWMSAKNDGSHWEIPL